MISQKQLLKLSVFCVVLFAVRVCVAEEKLLGDVDDGSRATKVHSIVYLRDEGGDKIDLRAKSALPFSMAKTCSECHSYSTISGGWHFNAIDPNVKGGRGGQAWIVSDARFGLQIPISYRGWPGALRPEQIGFTPWQFTVLFGRQIPGGGAGELDSDVPQEIMRQQVSGKVEINCLACHNGDSVHDQAEYASQIAKQNFRWAAGAACRYISVKGTAAEQGDTYDYQMDDAINVRYRELLADEMGRVFFDIPVKIANERCYFCHSNKVIAKEGLAGFVPETDVHLAAGLRCVDCHRNGLNHLITRGYEGEKNILAGGSACKDCHLGPQSVNPQSGRLGAPIAKHAGIPTAHFELLTCTACHSGPWPQLDIYRVKTSRGHALGTHGVNRSDDVLPHISTPIFAKGESGKIGPHNLVWPAYWASRDKEGLTPIKIDAVRKTLGGVLANVKVGAAGDWPGLSKEQVKKGLKAIASAAGGEIVYVAGGLVYSQEKDGSIAATEDKAASAYLWPIAHDVRPAAQALGVNGCKDCHWPDKALMFGNVAVDSPVTEEKAAVRKMSEFQAGNALFDRLFALSFVFRPMMKVVVLCSCGIVGAVLALYGLRALKCVVKVFSERE